MSLFNINHGKEVEMKLTNKSSKVDVLVKELLEEGITEAELRDILMEAARKISNNLSRAGDLV